MRKSKHIEEIQEVAASQWGMFTTAQAQERGARRDLLQRMAADGRTESMRRGVYRYAVVPLDVNADIKAAWLAVEPGKTGFQRLEESPCSAVVAGRTAAVVHDCGDFYETPYTFIVPSGRRSVVDDTCFLNWTIDPCDVVVCRGLPVTSFERTVADLVRLNEELEHIGLFMADALSMGHSFDEDRLAELLAPLAARNGFGRKNGNRFASELLQSAKKGF